MAVSFIIFVARISGLLAPLNIVGGDMKNKPKLLDLFCGAGGASMGYYRAGFQPYGIDNNPQPNYPFPFLLMDAFEASDRLLRGEGLTFSNGETLYLKDFSAFHASPPCQLFSTAYSMNVPQGKGKAVNLIPQTREMLLTGDKPFVIENIPRAPLRKDLLLCGTMFGLGVFRHRVFECSSPILNPLHPKHNGRIGDGKYYCITQNGWDYVRLQEYDLEKWKLAMGIDWHINKRMLAEAIPPAYTEYIGKYLIKYV